MDTSVDWIEGGLLTVTQACKFLNCGKKKLYRLYRADKIQMVKLGHSTRVTESSLRRLIGNLPALPQRNDLAAGGFTATSKLRP